MRALAILLSILLTVPLVAALAPAAAPNPTAAIPPLPTHLSDGDLLMLLAAHKGIQVERAPAVVVPQDATVPDLVRKLGERSSAAMTDADVAMFQELDARVAAPVLTLLVAVDQAWDMNDMALAGLSAEAKQEVAQLIEQGEYDSPKLGALGEPVDREMLLREAILLLDTIESIVLPQLEAAAQSGAWPATAIADPVGVLRLGGTGNDIETINRMIQIDPRGDDTYRNNAGGNTLLADRDPTTLDFPIAVSLDMHGADSYLQARNSPGLGAAFLGAGLLLELEGNDRYECRETCLGFGSVGVGIARDFRGDDVYLGGVLTSGAAMEFGMLRDDHGNDYYRVLAGGGGWSGARDGIGLLWDREGADYYESYYSELDVFGYALDGGDGWFVDEGAYVDTYWIRQAVVPHPRACNNCTWLAGFAEPKTGRGNDNHGGLAYLLSYQSPYAWPALPAAGVAPVASA